MPVVKKSWSICFHDKPEQVFGEICDNCRHSATLLVTFGGRYGFCCNDNVCRNAVAKEIVVRAPESPEMAARKERESRQKLEHETARLSPKNHSLPSAQINRSHEVVCPRCSRTFVCFLGGATRCPRCEKEFRAYY